MWYSSCCEEKQEIGIILYVLCILVGHIKISKVAYTRHCLLAFIRCCLRSEFLMDEEELANQTFFRVDVVDVG